MSEQSKVNEKMVYPFIVNTQYGHLETINCFLYNDGKKLTLIDAGINTPEYWQFLQKALQEHHLSIQDVDQIVLTHHHDDHIGHVNTILAQKEMPVFAHHLAIPRLRGDIEFKKKRKQFFRKLYEEYGSASFIAEKLEQMKEFIHEHDALTIHGEIQPLVDGDIVGGLQVIEVPGHTIDSIILYDEQAKWQFAGDLLLKNSSTNALVDFGDDLELLPTVAQYENSLLTCKDIPTNWVFPGHQEPFDEHGKIVDQKLARIQMKCQRVVKAVQQGNSDLLTIAKTLYGSKLEQEFILVLSEVIGFLEYAYGKGYISKMMKNDQWHFTAN